MQVETDRDVQLALESIYERQHALELLLAATIRRSGADHAGLLAYVIRDVSWITGDEINAALYEAVQLESEEKAYAGER